jgi:hypothetical protein
MPASIIAFSTGSELQAGPMVAMTLVFLNFLRWIRVSLAKSNDNRPIIAANAGAITVAATRRGEYLVIVGAGKLESRRRPVKEYSQGPENHEIACW